MLRPDPDVASYAPLIHRIILPQIITPKPSEIRSSANNLHLMKIQLTLALSLITATITLGQGTFQNLDFEQANTTGYSPESSLPSVDAFPGWATLVGGTPVSTVGYDNPTLAAAGIELVGPSEAIQGNYSPVLEGSPYGGTASLVQTGVIPSGTESIQLDAGEENAGNFWVEINGNQVNMFPLQPNAGPRLMVNTRFTVVMSLRGQARAQH
jgi:hypothetical protein